MKVALVHDYLIQYGGAERVLEEFSNLFPHAPIYTLVYDEAATGYAFESRQIRTSFLQRIPNPASNYRLFPLLMPLAIESFDLSDYDLVISSSASFAKGVVATDKALHISYCHTPMRYAWFDYKQIAGDSIYPSPLAKLIPLLMPYMRLWDKNSSQRPDYFICNSGHIQKKIKKYYKRDAHVIHPPLNFHRFSPESPEDYFLMVGRMVPYKRFDLAIQTFNKLELPLKIVGSGPEIKKLKEMAGPTIEFTGLVSEEELASYYARAQALIFPQEEDFGITALESMASGRPVIAYGKGGAVEMIEDGKTGVLFNEQSIDSLKKAVHRFNSLDLSSEYIRASVEKFDKMNFRAQIISFIEEKLKENEKHFII
ncbi:MAG: glycosyltransferase [Candidatus Spechtbacterales bacterium]